MPKRVNLDGRRWHLEMPSKERRGAPFLFVCFIVVVLFKFLCLPRFVFNKNLEKAKVLGAVKAGNPFLPDHRLDYTWTVLRPLTLIVCVLLYVCMFSFHNQTIVYICTLARSHKEEHPNNEEKSQTGERAGWERKPRYFAFSPCA